MATVAVRVGSSPDTMQLINPNDEANPTRIDSPEFIGDVLVRINNFRGVVPAGKTRIATIPYFTGRKRIHSIQVQGRFRRPWCLEDLVWASDWDAPLRVSKMTGFFTKFWQMVDPGSTAQLAGDKPFVQSYVITSACAAAAWRAGETAGDGNGNGPGPFRLQVEEDVQALLPPHLAAKMAGAKSANTGAATAATAATAAGSSTPTGPATPSAPAGRFSLFSRSTSNASATKAAADAAKADAANREQLVSARRKLFTSAETRQQVMINPDTVFAFESFNPFFDPNTFRIKMPAVSIDLRSMLCGQPFRMALRSKDKSVTFLVIEILVSDAASASGNGNGSGNGSGNGDDGSGNGGDDEDGVGDLRDMGMTGSTLSGGAASGIWGDNDIVLDEDIPKLPGDEAV